MIGIVCIGVGGGLGYYLSQEENYKKKSAFYRWLMLGILGIFLGLSGYLSLNKFGYQPSFYSYYVLTGLIGLMACIDLLTYHIPDELLIIGGIIGVAALAVNPNIVWYINIGATVVTVGVMFMLSKLLKGGIGSGDGYVLGLITLFLGWEQMVIVFLSALVLSGVVGILLIVSGKGHKKTILPFVPFIAIVQMMILFI